MVFLAVASCCSSQCQRVERFEPWFLVCWVLADAAMACLGFLISQACCQHCHHLASTVKISASFQLTHYRRRFSNFSGPTSLG